MERTSLWRDESLNTSPGAHRLERTLVLKFSPETVRFQIMDTQLIFPPQDGEQSIKRPTQILPTDRFPSPNHVSGDKTNLHECHARLRRGERTAQQKRNKTIGSGSMVPHRRRVVLGPDDGRAHTCVVYAFPPLVYSADRSICQHAISYITHTRTVREARGGRSYLVGTYFGNKR